jgi:hypothetical protein
MQKIIALQVGLFIATLAAIIPLAYSLLPVTITNKETIDCNTQKAIIFNLREGQTITDSLDYNSKPNTNGNWYLILDPNGNEATERTVEDFSVGGKDGHGMFTFTAKVSGEWYISTTTIFGFNPLVLIGLVIAVWVIAEIAVLRVKKKTLNKTKTSINRTINIAIY